MENEHKIIKYTHKYYLQYAILYQETWKEEPYGEYFTLEEIAAQIPNNQMFLFLCIDTTCDKVIGFVGGRPLEHCNFFDNKIHINLKQYFYVDELGVHVDYRNKGLGKFLMNFIMAETTKSGFSKFILRTHGSKENPAKKLYEKLGFSKIILNDNLAFGIDTTQARIDSRPNTDFRPYYQKVQ